MTKLCNCKDCKRRTEARFWDIILASYSIEELLALAPSPVQR